MVRNSSARSTDQPIWSAPSWCPNGPQVHAQHRQRSWVGSSPACSQTNPILCYVNNTFWAECDKKKWLIMTQCCWQGLSGSFSPFDPSLWWRAVTLGIRGPTIQELLYKNLQNGYINWGESNLGCSKKLSLCVSLVSIFFPGLNNSHISQLFHQPVHWVSPDPHYSFPL